MDVFDAVSHFNIGATAASKTLERMGISPGECCLARCLMADKQHIEKAGIKSAEKTKKKRRIIRAKRKSKGDKQKKKGQTYACGEY